MLQGFTNPGVLLYYLGVLLYYLEVLLYCLGVLLYCQAYLYLHGHNQIDPRPFFRCLVSHRKPFRRLSLHRVVLVLVLEEDGSRVVKREYLGFFFLDMSEL